jgi:hypothetical protein
MDAKLLNYLDSLLFLASTVLTFPEVKDVKGMWKILNCMWLVTVQRTSE